MPIPFSKLSGGGSLPEREPLPGIAMAWIGGLLAIAAVALATDTLGMPMVLGSFGASCVLVFGFPKSPFSQPRNVIAGHFLSSLIGLLFFTAFGAVWWSMALALACAIAAMQLTRTVHPPAGSNPVIVMLTHPSWAFLVTPTLLGVLLILLVALVINNIGKARRYPVYWLG
ncbi:MAG: HPP family protein [Gammaproteobacteria bacterium]|nr:HPP family protein [Gammaproteobacteria bacterium]